MSSTNAIRSETVPAKIINSRQRILQNFLLIYIDEDLDKSKITYENTLIQLQNVINNDIHVFTQLNEAIHFLNEVENSKIFVIIPATIGLNIVSYVKDNPQIEIIYILCDSNSQHQELMSKEYKKTSLHTNITSICQALQAVTKQYHQDSIAISFITVDEDSSIRNINQLEPSFMYTQIFKEILLEMNYDEKSIKTFIQFWRQYCIDNIPMLNIIAEFERSYSPESSILWYTRETFVYQMLNYALRSLDGDIIINMGFFIRDLYKQIAILHQRQRDNYRKKSFIVYRGQGLSKSDFAKLLKFKESLMSFNNFLSTSSERAVSFIFAESASTKFDTIGILFKMMIDPSISSAPFASIEEVSYFQDEEEILFSMHTVFRIGQVSQINNNETLYEVELTLTSDDDPQLRILTECIRNEVQDETGWKRLGSLLLKINQLEKAEQLYNTLLEQTINPNERPLYYNQLGYIKNHQGDYPKAIEYYVEALEIGKKILSPNYMHLAAFHNNLGEVYRNIGQYANALSSYEKTVEICQTNLSSHHPSLAIAYNNMGLVYDSTGEYSQALPFYEKTLEIYQTILPPIHPNLGQCYNNIGLLYDNMGEYSKALSFYEKSLEIREKALPVNHPHLAESYNNIGGVYYNIENYYKAMAFYETALEIRQKALPSNHPLLSASYNNLGEIYRKLGDYVKAHSLCMKALEIKQTILPTNYPDLGTAYNNIGRVYADMNKYSDALSCYEKACAIFEKALPENHPLLATTYNNIGSVYRNLKEYSKALAYYEHALGMLQHSLPSNHSYIQSVQNSITLINQCLMNKNE